MKKVGIGVDDWKITRFRKELLKLGFSDIEIIPFVDKTSLITVSVPVERVHDVHKLCVRLQKELRHRN